MLDIKIVEIGYFLSRCGVEKPPEKLKATNWKDAINCFYKKLNNGKTEKEFYNSLKNVRDHFDSHLNNARIGWHNEHKEPDRLPEQYLFVLNYLKKLTDDALWGYLKNYVDLNSLDLDKKDLYWKFDISTFRLLGRELITDRITALVELVKNSYDANAKNVYIKFINTDQKGSGKIIICDDGFGMNSHDIESKWMTIGTNSKRKEKFTPEPFNRRVVGEKGIGRFAIDKLGSHCRIFTKKDREKQINILTINWDHYDNNNSTNDFLEVTNQLTKKIFVNKISGVKFAINNLHDIWTNQDLNRVYKEMAKIVSPFNTLYPPFNIHISSNVYDDYKKSRLVKNEAIKYASEKFIIEYDSDKKTQQSLLFKEKSLQIQEIPIPEFGPIKFQLYYFNQYEKGNFSKNYHGAELQIDGIKIYRDGILATPFAEHQAEQKDQRDILGIDKRRWSGFFDKISSRDIIGIIEIKRDLSPNIIDATNRQDFIANQDYEDLKAFIIHEVSEFEKYLKFKKSELYEVVGENLEDAKDQIDGFSSDLKDLKVKLNDKHNVNINKELKKLEDTARKANIALKQGIKKQHEEKKEATHKESMYMSLMSLQTYALEITHIIKTSLGTIKRRAEFNLKHYGKEQYKDYTKKYNFEIMTEINKLDQAINFMSTYTKSEKNWEAFNIDETINGVFDSLSPIFEKEKVELQVEIQNNITLVYNTHLLEDIIKNLINNSIKALKNKEKKLIKLSGYIEDKNLIIIFSDNGEGILEKNKEKIYEIYYTTTAEDGGNGMGLYMVKTNLEAIKGEIDLISSELDNGATFKLTFPFNNKEES